MHRVWAFVMGYFWMPCPLCGESFGGHEWAGGASSIRVRGFVTYANGVGICPVCTELGLGGDEYSLEELDKRYMDAVGSRYDLIK